MSTTQQFNRNLDLSTSTSNISATEMRTSYLTLGGVRSNVFVPDNSVTTQKIVDENVTYDKLQIDVRQKRLLNARAWNNLQTDSASVGFFNITTGWNQHPTSSFIYDPYNQFNETNGRWTCPETGYYHFSGSSQIKFTKSGGIQNLAEGDIIQAAFRISEYTSTGNPAISPSDRIQHFDIKTVICSPQNYANTVALTTYMNLSFDWQGGPIVSGEQFCLQLAYGGRLISGTGALENLALFGRPTISVVHMDFNMHQILDPNLF